MVNIFKTLLKIRPFRVNSKGVPYGIMRNELLTGYIGEEMHQNFYKLNRLRKKL